MFKKGLVIAAAVGACLSLAACGKTDTGTSISKDDDVVATKPQQNTPSGTKELNITDDDIVRIVKYPEIEVVAHPNLERFAISDVSDIKSDSVSDGLYNIVGHAEIVSSNSWMCELYLNHIDSGIESLPGHRVNVKACGFPKAICYMMDSVYIDLHFYEDEMTVDMIDRNTGESLLGYTDEELMAKYFPELSYDVVDCGALENETVKLSTLTPGKTYAFDNSEKYDDLLLINDTDSELLVTRLSASKGAELERVIVPTNSYHDEPIELEIDSGEVLISVVEITADDIKAQKGVISLGSQSLEVGSAMSFDADDIICNDTDKTYVINLLTFDNKMTWGDTIELKPGDLLSAQDSYFIFVVTDIK